MFFVPSIEVTSRACAPDSAVRALALSAGSRVCNKRCAREPCRGSHQAAADDCFVIGFLRSWQIKSLEEVPTNFRRAWRME
jgi:hypothetical protein